MTNRRGANGARLLFMLAVSMGLGPHNAGVGGSSPPIATMSISISSFAVLPQPCVVRRDQIVACHQSGDWCPYIL